MSMTYEVFDWKFRVVLHKSFWDELLILSSLSECARWGIFVVLATMVLLMIVVYSL